MGGKSKEVIHISSSNPLVYVNTTSFATFEQHTKGVGMKLLPGMGYEGGHVGINGQGITNLIKVKERPKYQGLGYGHRVFGECSKLSEVKKSSDDDMSTNMVVIMVIYLPREMNFLKDFACRHPVLIIKVTSPGIGINVMGIFQMLVILIICGTCILPFFVMQLIIVWLILSDAK